jgi:hypothetical protein
MREIKCRPEHSRTDFPSPEKRVNHDDSLQICMQDFSPP